MFQELAPLLAERTLLLTIAQEGEDLLRVNVIPKRLKEGDPTEAALSTPLTIVGTAAELDRDLPAQLLNFASSVISTHSTIMQVKESHQAALKEIEAANKKELRDKQKSSSGTNNSSKAATSKEKPGPAFKDNKPVFGAKPSPSLFDVEPEVTQPDPGAAAPAQDEPAEENDDDLEA